MCLALEKAPFLNLKSANRLPVGCVLPESGCGLLSLVPALAGVLLGFPRGTGPGDLTASASDGGHTVGPPAGDGIAEALRLLGSGCAAAVWHWTTPFVVCGEIATSVSVSELVVLVKLDTKIPSVYNRQTIQSHRFLAF